MKGSVIDSFLFLAFLRASHVLPHEHSKRVSEQKRTDLREHAHGIVLEYDFRLLRTLPSDGGRYPVERVNDVVHRRHVPQGVPVPDADLVLVELDILESVEPVLYLPSHLNRLGDLLRVCQGGQKVHRLSLPLLPFLPLGGYAHDDGLGSFPFRGYLSLAEPDENAFPLRKRHRVVRLPCAEEPADRLVQAFLVVLDRKTVVSLPADDGPDGLGLAVQGIRSDDGVSEGEPLQQLLEDRNLVCLALHVHGGQDDSAGHVIEIEHVDCTSLSLE